MLMNKRRTSFLVAFCAVAMIALGYAGARAGWTPKPTPRPASYSLLSSLPPSNFIAYFDAQHILTDGVRGVFAEEPNKLAEIERHFERFKTEMGFDLRTFDAVAIGATVESNQREPAFVVLARGRFESNALIDLGFDKVMKESKNLERRSLQYEGKTIYVMMPKVAAGTSTTPDSVASYPSGADDSISDDMVGRRIAFVALDTNTIAFGSLKNVKAAIDSSMGRERVNDELVQLATRSPNAVFSFSGNVSSEILRSFRLPAKAGATPLDSIKQIYGASSLVGSDIESNVNMRTETADQARQVGQGLSGLKFLASMSGRMATNDRDKTLLNMIQNVNIDTVGNEVQITMRVAQTDIGSIVRHF